MAKTPVIKATNLSKTFKLGKDNEVIALHSVNFEIFSGELICFFGPSGCGKSTLLSMLAGLQPPTSGEILVRGKNLAELKKKELSAYRRQKIGMVFQQFNLIISMNVLENIALPMAFGGTSRKRRMQRAEHLLEVVDLSDKQKSIPADLSGGQQQRVAVARSLINNPWIIMADEPTGNLDSKSADDVMKLLISLSRKSKRTVVLITHNPDYLQYVDRIFRMKDGKIVKIEVNDNATKVELMDSVSKLDNIKKEDSDIEEDMVYMGGNETPPSEIEPEKTKEKKKSSKKPKDYDTNLEREVSDLTNDWNSNKKEEEIEGSDLDIETKPETEGDIEQEVPSKLIETETPAPKKKKRKKRVKKMQDISVPTEETPIVKDTDSNLDKEETEMPQEENILVENEQPTEVIEEGKNQEEAQSEEDGIVSYSVYNKDYKEEKAEDEDI